MVNIKLIYLKNIYIIKNAKQDSLLIEILKNYSNMINKNIKDLYFLSKGKYISINNKKKIYEFKKNLSISVFDLSVNKDKNYLNPITCPICDSLVTININEDKISLENCINNHNFYNLSLDAFLHLVNFNNKNAFKCSKCGNYSNDYNNKFYFCSCKNILCPICSTLHNKAHELIEYINRFNFCLEHKSKFIIYCNSCNMNLCDKCEQKHYKHKRVYFKQIIPPNRTILEFTSDIKNAINYLNNYKKELIEMASNLNKFVIKLNQKNDDNLSLYEYINRYSNNLINYQNITSLDKFKIKKQLKEIKSFLNNNINDKLKNLAELYDN